MFDALGIPESNRTAVPLCLPIDCNWERIRKRVPLSGSGELINYYVRGDPSAMIGLKTSDWLAGGAPFLWRPQKGRLGRRRASEAAADHTAEGEGGDGRHDHGSGRERLIPTPHC